MKRKQTKAAQDRVKARKKVARLKATMIKTWRVWRTAYTVMGRAKGAEERAYNTYCEALNTLHVAAKDEGG